MTTNDANANYAKANGSNLRSVTVQIDTQLLKRWRAVTKLLDLTQIQTLHEALSTWVLRHTDVVTRAFADGTYPQEQNDDVNAAE